MSNAVKVTLVKSPAHCTAKQKGSVRGLGLRKLNSSRVVASTPENLGMINAISFLLHCEEAKL